MNKKQRNKKNKKVALEAEEKAYKKWNAIVIGLFIFGALYHTLIEPKTIGHDIRYSIYILSEEEQKLVHSIEKSSNNGVERLRCRLLILSNKKLCMKEISRLTDTNLVADCALF